MNGSESLKSRSGAPFRLVFIYILFSLLAIISGFFFLNKEERSDIKEKKIEISTIADLYVKQIANWRLERMSNAQAIYKIPLFANLLKNCSKNPENHKLLNEFTVTLGSIRELYRLESILAIDTKLNVICSSGKYANTFGETARNNIDEALRDNKIVFSDLHRNSTVPEIHMDIYIPIILKNSGKEVPVGVILIRVDPEQFLFPLIRSWPVPSKTSEALLVSRQGDDVVFLNELRHQKATALNLRFPVSTKNLVEAMAVRGVEDTVEGVDYRGKPVIAVLRNIPDSPWFLIAKADKDEIYGPIHRGQITLAVLILVFIMLGGSVLAFFWKKNNAEFYRKQLEFESEKAAIEKHFRYINKYANDIIILIGPGEKIIEANEKALATYGYTHEEILALDPHKIRAPEQDLPTPKLLEQIIKTGGDIFETIHRRKDGTTFPVEVSARILEIEGVNYLHTIMRDITERKKLEQRMEAFFTESPAGLCIMDDQGRYIKINKKMANINGYTIEEHLGRTIEELLPQLSPVLMPVYKDIIENGKTYSNMEISSETHGESGKKKTWIGSSFPLPGPGPKRNYVGAIVVDITAQKEFEAALKTERDQVKLYMDVASAVFLILDKESRIMLINKKGYEVLGYDEGSLIGKKWFETCVPADKGGKSRSVFDGVISGKVPPVEYAENEVLTKSGAKRTVAFHSAFIRDENNEIIAVLFSGNDITDKKIAEESLRKLNEELETRVKERTTQLESVNVELEAFAYSVSHDLRAPLRAIDGFSKILLEDHSDKLDSEAKRLLDIVRNNTKNMGQLIDGLMAFARLGKEELRIVELNMEEMAISVFEEISAQYRQRNIDFAIKRLHPVMGDSAMMRQVLYNLINNSAKYTRNNPTAFIEVGSVHEGNKITYYVKDNGVGFNPEYAYKLFGVFERLHSNSEFEGTGVGLAIVERIIKRHGGSVRAEGKVNEGAVFYFSLPVKNII